MKKYIYLILSFATILSCKKSGDELDISGSWSVALDSLRSSQYNIQLPGSLCDAGIGNPNTIKPTMEKEVFLNLKTKYSYVGPAWYEREIEIPAHFKGKKLQLSLERVLWSSELWVDGQKINMLNESLTTCHEFDLPELTPGKHVFTIKIDNTKRHDISIKNLAHAYTNDTQTMWNGVLGKMRIKVKDVKRIRNMQIFSEPETKKIQVKVNLASIPDNEELNIRFEVEGMHTFRSKLIAKNNKVEFDYEMPEAELWSEFNPKIYKAALYIEGVSFTDKQTSSFGMRKIETKGRKILINNKEAFMRGTLECCIFPLKGYPPMDKQSWEILFQRAKEYGLNHLRFHSWCPPEAAFEAADQLGFYLQVESPLWALNVGKDTTTTLFIENECKRIMESYGNHPSFCFFALGNELEGNFDLMNHIISNLKKEDKRRLYMVTTFTFQQGHGSVPEPADDYWVTQWTKDGWVRGQGVFDTEYPNFNKDYEASLKNVEVPLITHEIGQYSVYPDLSEIEKYTGNLLPLNFIAVKEDLKRKKRLDQAELYTKASGKLAALLYKEEIERAYKTKGLSGFQLLDLHDFPGQGTALVGLLNAFWESKGLITAEQFRQFSSPVVLLARFPKAIYSNTETFEADLEMIDYGNESLKDKKVLWKLAKAGETEIAKGQFSIDKYNESNLSLGKVLVNLNKVSLPEQLVFSVSIEDTEYKNEWKLWVYPQGELEMGKIKYTSDYAQAEKLLKAGERVLLNPQLESMEGLDGKFVQVFWSPVHFPNQPGTMGIVCDPKHPLMKLFPTDFHTDWQWWDICKNSKTMVLDSVKNTVSLITMVDNFFKNRELSLLFEAKVGEGKLIFTSIDFNSLLNRPASQQLLKSIYAYMNSDDFNPQNEIDFEKLPCFFKKNDLKPVVKKGIYDE